MYSRCGCWKFFNINIWAAKNLPNEKRSFAGGFINAGGSFGQFVFAPLAQAIINSFDGSTYDCFAFSTLLTIPFSKILSSKSKKRQIFTECYRNDIKLKRAIKSCLKDKSLYLNLGFLLVDLCVAFWLHIFLMRLLFLWS